MNRFEGFPKGKTRFTAIPDLFFVELLQQIDDLGELKLILYMFYCLNRQRGYPRYMTVPELEAEGPLLTALLTDQDQDPKTRLHDAIERAVARRTLLRLRVGEDGDQVDYLFINTALGRRAVDEVQKGALILEKTGPVREPRIARERPSILDLYEQNIGLLQPILTDELLEADETYPASWIEQAFKIAAEHNARRWRYVKSILERWAAQGKDHDRPYSGPLRGEPRR